jgi:hypothetical protein
MMYVQKYFVAVVVAVDDDVVVALPEVSYNFKDSIFIQL